MFNSSMNKTLYNNTLDKSAFFDFNRHGFSPLLKSKVSNNFQEAKENNYYQDDYFINQDFLRNSLLKDKIQLNNVNTIDSPFNLNFTDRRNSQTHQGIMQHDKNFSSYKILANFNTNLNLPPKNFDKNFLSDNNNEKSKNSNSIFSNALTESNCNIFKSLKDKSKERKNLIKYADDYSFKKKNLTFQVDDIPSNKEDIKVVQIEINQNKQIDQDKLFSKRNSRFNGNDNEIDSISKLNQSISIKNKKLKKLNQIKFKKQLNNNKNYKRKNFNNILANKKSKEKKIKSNLLFNSQIISNIKIDDIEKENKKTKDFSFLKQKRIANISSSLFGPSNLNNNKSIFKSFDNKNPNKTIKAKKDSNVDSETFFSLLSEDHSESEYILSQEAGKYKGEKIAQRAKKKFKENNNKKESVMFSGKIESKEKKNSNNDICNKNIHDIRENEKNILLDFSTLEKNYQEHEKHSYSFSFRKEDKTYSPKNKLIRENNICDILNFKDSLACIITRRNGFSIEKFDEIFGKKKFSLKKKNPHVLKNLISYVDSKVNDIYMNKENPINSSFETQKDPNSALDIVRTRENNSFIDSLTNLNRNIDYLFEPFDDDESMKKFSTYGNNKVKDILVDYIVWGKPNNKKLGFGDCPLNNYADWYLKGKEIYYDFTTKIEDKEYLSKYHSGKNPKRDFQKHASTKLIDITLKMKEISYKLSEYPIFDFGLSFKFKSDKEEKNHNINFKKTAPTNITEKVLAKQNIHKKIINKEIKSNNNEINKNIDKTKKTLKNKKQTKEADDNSSPIEESDYSNSKYSDEEDIEKLEGYNCDICGQIFSNGQGLGGHMSRKHPNQSEKYKFKKETRDKRNWKREILYKAQRILLCRFKQDYDKLKLSNEGRRLIKKTCKDHKQEYYRIKREVKSLRNMNTKKKTSN